MAKREHIHRYKKVDLGADGKVYLVYKCTKPLCNHYIPINLAEGRMCECNKCGEPMLISKTVLTGSGGGPMARPHCSDCKKPSKKGDDIAAISDFLNKSGI